MVSPQQNLKVPTVAVDYRADVNQPLPPLSRVGVDTNDQHLTLREAIALALANNKDIEVARDNVKIAEYDLLTIAVHMIPGSALRLITKSQKPGDQLLSGAAKVETSDFTGTARFEA